MTSRRCRAGCHALVLSVALGTLACGGKPPVNTLPDLQTRIRPGHTVYVIDTSGVETRGKLLALTPSELTVQHDGQVRRFQAASVRQVQRYGDSLWNGTLIGIAASVPGAFFSDPRQVPCPNAPARSCSDYEGGSRALVIAVGGLAGLGIDAMIRHRRPVYVAPGATVRSLRVTPFVARRSGGVMVVVHY